MTVKYFLLHTSNLWFDNFINKIVINFVILAIILMQMARAVLNQEKLNLPWCSRKNIAKLI